MTKRLLIALMSVGLMAGVLAGPTAAAQGGPDRYQTGTTTYTLTVAGAYIHTFEVTTNPCDGSITITGMTLLGSPYYTLETVTGTLTAGVITFNSTYTGPYNTGYQWSGSFLVGGGPLTASDSSGPLTGTVAASPTTFTTYKNHGDYVSSTGGGADAAHSCIGMPKNSAADAGGASVVATLAANAARLLANLEAVVARLEAGNANSHATAAIQKHVDALKAGTAGPGAAAGAKGSSHATKPTLPSQATNHPTPGNHGKP